MNNPGGGDVSQKAIGMQRAFLLVNMFSRGTKCYVIGQLIHSVVGSICFTQIKVVDIMTHEYDGKEYIFLEVFSMLDFLKHSSYGFIFCLF